MAGPLISSSLLLPRLWQYSFYCFYTRRRICGKEGRKEKLSGSRNSVDSALKLSMRHWLTLRCQFQDVSSACYATAVCVGCNAEQTTQGILEEQQTGNTPSFCGRPGENVLQWCSCFAPKKLWVFQITGEGTWYQGSACLERSRDGLLSTQP